MFFAVATTIRHAVVLDHFPTRRDELELFARLDVEFLSLLACCLSLKVYPNVSFKKNAVIGLLSVAKQAYDSGYFALGRTGHLG